MKLISANIFQDKIQLALEQRDDQKQWSYLKQEANAVNLRLLECEESEAFHKRKIVPAMSHGDVDHLQTEDPWSSKPAKVAASSSKRRPPPIRPLVEARPRPEDWLDETGPPVAVLAPANVKSTASGVAAVDLDAANRLLAHSTKAWTLVPLALFVVSDSAPDSPLPCEELTILMNVPSGPVVCVRGFLVQLGTVSVKRRTFTQVAFRNLKVLKLCCRLTKPTWTYNCGSRCGLHLCAKSSFWMARVLLAKFCPVDGCHIQTTVRLFSKL